MNVKTIATASFCLLAAASPSFAGSCNSGGCSNVGVTVVIGASGNPSGDNRPCFFYSVTNGYSPYYAIPYSDPGAPYNIGRIRQAYATGVPVSFAAGAPVVACSGFPLTDDVQ